MKYYNQNQIYQTIVPLKVHLLPMSFHPSLSVKLIKEGIDKPLWILLIAYSATKSETRNS